VVQEAALEVVDVALNKVVEVEGQKGDENREAAESQAGVRVVVTKETESGGEEEVKED
jgi:hypothetical protein